MSQASRHTEPRHQRRRSRGRSSASLSAPTTFASTSVAFRGVAKCHHSDTRATTAATSTSAIMIRPTDPPTPGPTSGVARPRPAALTAAAAPRTNTKTTTTTPPSRTSAATPLNARASLDRDLILEDLTSDNSSVTLITTFQLRDGVELDHFVRLWTDVAHWMERRPGFVSARLYRVSRPGEVGRYIQVAHWSRGSLLAAARADPDVRLAQRDVHRLLTRADRMVCKPVTEEIMPSH